MKETLKKLLWVSLLKRCPECHEVLARSTWHTSTDMNVPPGTYGFRLCINKDCDNYECYEDFYIKDDDDGQGIDKAGM